MSIIYNDQCSICNSKDVCRYKDEFLKIKKIIEDEAAAYEEFITVNIGCKHRKGITIRTLVRIPHE